MNQILMEEMAKPKTDIKNIIKFFSIAILIFGVILVGIGIFQVVQWAQSKAPVSTNKPEISASVFEDGSIIINITHDKEIDRILYNWNDGEDTIILGRNRKNIEQLIEMPIGENVFNIRVIDTKGIEATYTNTYVYSNGVDIQNPTVELTVQEAEKQIHILASDETEIAYITYRWNDEEETTINTVDESKTIIEANVDIPKGENTLTVVAVDNNNNQATKTQKCLALTRPVIVKPRQNGDKLTITVTDEDGLDYVEYTVNGKKYKWVSTTEDRKEWTYVHVLEPGESDIVIKAFNKSGIESTTFHGKCVYTP